MLINLMGFLYGGLSAESANPRVRRQATFAEVYFEKVVQSHRRYSPRDHQSKHLTKVGFLLLYSGIIKA